MQDNGANTTRWSYDRRGQLIAERKQIGSGVFYTRWGYNPAGMQSWMRYPGGAGGESGELVTSTYLPQGLQNSLVGDTTYVQSTTYDAVGRMDVRTLGSNLLKTDYDYFAWTITNGQGRLKRLTSGTPANPTSLQDLRYYGTSGAPAYDAVGNLLHIYDYKAGNPQEQAFTYDNLNRLTGAAARGGRGASTPRATPTIRTPATCGRRGQPVIR